VYGKTALRGDYENAIFFDHKVPILSREDNGILLHEADLQNTAVFRCGAVDSVTVIFQRTTVVGSGQAMSKSDSFK
jgi:hypothetical protein